MTSFLLVGSITCGLLALTVVGVMGWDSPGMQRLVAGIKRWWHCLIWLLRLSTKHQMVDFYGEGERLWIGCTCGYCTYNPHKIDGLHIISRRGR